MDSRIADLIANLQARNILGSYCPDKQAAADRILGLIPVSASVGFSGSQTLEQIGILGLLEARGNKLFNPYKPGISKEESLELRKQGADADYYLASANAIAQSGELVFFSAFGNRTAGISYAKNVIIVCGVNKITPDIHSAITRAREVATPLNYQRLNWESSRRMCCQVLIIEGEAVAERLKVILVGEELGF